MSDKEEFEEAKGVFISLHPDWKYADTEALWLYFWKVGRKELEAAKQRIAESVADAEKWAEDSERLENKCSELIDQVLTSKHEKEALEKKLANFENRTNCPCLCGDFCLNESQRTTIEALEKKLAEQQAVLVYWNYYVDYLLGGAEELIKLLAAARQQGFEEGEQVGRDKLQKELSEQEPFGVWHQGATEDESDFFLGRAVDAEDCSSCTVLIPRPLPPIVKGD